jgi:hypothetical protein
MVCLSIPFGLVLLLLSLSWLASSWRTIQSVWRAEHWACTQGETESAELEVMKGAKYNRHYARITYRYEVAGEAFTGTRVAFGLTQHNQGAAEAVLDRYPTGCRVTVWYDPEQPAHSVLEPRCDWLNLTMNVAFACVTLGFSCLMIWLGIAA